MNVDVSPDGKTIAFDLLGDIYTMPITGGKATAIRSGLAWKCNQDGVRMGKSCCSPAMPVAEIIFG